MCDCYQKLCDELKEKLHPDATFVSGQIEFFSGRTYSNFNFTIPGRKKDKTEMVLNSFCPHCGEKYPVK